ncbi:hypothetical protein EJ110_NYTH57225 [Nymphaea thermarum]|nr:hypothetical protein EJ110_NYTH57225 [Nymphaea thermarum]
MKSSPFSSLITKMNGGNYEMWAMQVKRTLIAHEKEHLILEPEPVQKVGKYGTWFKDNSLVMVWIVGTLYQDIANEVLHKESAKDMWDSLAATYSQARNETRIMQLHHDIHQMRQDGRPLHTYYSSLKSMFERLNSYFPTCKCEQQKAYRDMLMVGVFLSGLDSVYESAKNQMLTSPSIPPIDEAYSKLSRIPIPAATVPDTTSAMLATRSRGGSFFARGRGGRGRGPPTSRPVCQFCHRIGHTVDKCWQKHGRPAFANQIASTESSEPPKAQHIAPSSELRVSSVDPRFGAVYQRRTRPVAAAPCAPVPSPSMPKSHRMRSVGVFRGDLVVLGFRACSRFPHRQEGCRHRSWSHRHRSAPSPSASAAAAVVAASAPSLAAALSPHRFCVVVFSVSSAALPVFFRWPTLCFLPLLMSRARAAISRPLILRISTAYEMWTILARMYGRKKRVLHTYQIKRSIYALRQGESSVASFYAALKTKWEELDYHTNDDWKNASDQALYWKKEWTDRTFIFLGGLRDEFESVRSQLLNCDEIPGIEEVYARVETEEQRRQIMHIDTSHGSSPTAFVSRTAASCSWSSSLHPAGSFCA